MKKRKSIFSRVLSLLLSAIMAFGIMAFAGCDFGGGSGVTLTIDAKTKTLEVGQTAIIEVSVTGADDASVTFASANTDVLTVSSAGVVTAVGDVTENTDVIVTVIPTADPAKAGKITFTVTPKPAPEVSVSAAADKTTLAKGQNAIITPTVTGTDDDSVTYSSSNPDVLTVSAAGVAIAVGSVTENTNVTVTVTSVADSTKTAQITFTVTPPKADVKVTVTADKKELRKNDTAQLTVTVTGATESGYKFKSGDETLLSVSSAGVVTMIGDISASTLIAVTATSTEDLTASASFTFMLRPPVSDDRVENLTSAMIAKIGNSSITVNGVVTDYYVNFNRPINNRTTSYDMKVEMKEDAWKGEWWAQGHEENAITDMYKKGEGSTVNTSGLSGSPLNQVYINKNNQPVEKPVRDTFGNDVLWDSQHLWNHLGDLQIRKFNRDLDAEEAREDGAEVYAYDINYEDESLSGDLYLMAYLTVSLTPMLESGTDSFMYFYLVVDDGEIKEIIARSMVYYDTDKVEEANEMSYTEVTLTLSDIGTTNVSDPKAYAADANTDRLKAAIQKMQAAESYTWAATDRTISAPSGNDDDYTMSTPAKIGGGASSATTYKGVSNGTASEGTVGARGWIEGDNVLIETTSMYTYTMDGKPYRMEYTGYYTPEAGKTGDPKYYEKFVYDSSVENADGTKGALKGNKRVYGEVKDILPGWDFAAEIFEYVGPSNNNTRHTYTIRDSAINAELAPEVSMYRYAGDASTSSSTTFSIVVDSNGNIVSVTYPYSIVAGTYTGAVTTVYSKIGTTSIDAATGEDTFSDYVERKVPETWADFKINYRPGHSTQVPDNYQAGDEVVKAIFGKESANDVPSPRIFIDVFGDNLSWTVSHDWKGAGTDESPYIDFVSFNVSTDDYDEYYRPNDYTGLMENLRLALAQVGFVLDEDNTDTSKVGNRYVSYLNNTTGMMVVVQNIGTRYFYVYIYKAGDWTLRKD